MSATETEDCTSEDLNPGKAKPRSNKTVTVSVDDLERIINERIAATVEAMKRAEPVAQQNQWMHQFVGTPSPGQHVPMGTIPPVGWQIVPMQGGMYEIWPKPEGFNIMEKSDVLKRVDAAYADWMTPSKDDKKPVAPTHLYVNARWAKLFPSQMTRPWGDSTAVVKVADNAPELKDAEDLGIMSKARFRFAKVAE